GEVVARGDGGRREGAGGAAQHAVDGQFPVMGGETENAAVPPPDDPAGGEAGHLLRQMGRQLRRQAAHQTRTSTSPTDGASPAAKVSSEMSSRSSRNRTGTSNS